MEIVNYNDITEKTKAQATIQLQKELEFNIRVYGYNPPGPLGGDWEDLKIVTEAIRIIEFHYLFENEIYVTTLFIDQYNIWTVTDPKYQELKSNITNHLFEFALQNIIFLKNGTPLDEIISKDNNQTFIYNPSLHNKKLVNSIH